MFMGLGMPIPDLSNKPGPGRPGWGPTGTYDFQFEVTGAVTIKANAAGAGYFRVSWPSGHVDILSGNNPSVAAPDGTAGIVSINNEELDDTYADEFAIVSGQTNVSKVISWGQNPWSYMTNAFNGCTSLSDISTTSFISSAQGDMVTMFNGCTSLLEADIRNWDLSAGADWYGGSPFKGLANLQKLDMTGMNIKLTNRSDGAFSSIGTAVTNGCEFLMSNINWSTSISGYTVNWFSSTKFNPDSNLSNWIFPDANVGWAGNAMFNSADITGTNSTLNLSGWSTYSGAQLPQFSSFNSPAGDTGLKIDMTNMGTSNVTSLSSMFYYSDISEVIGLSTWGATAGNVNMSSMFVGCSYMKFSDSDNFTSTFINSLTPTNVRLAFYGVGGSLTSGYGVAPNITNIDLSNCTDFHQFFSGIKCTNVPALSTATFPSTAISLTNLFTGSRFISSNETHLDFSNTTIKIGNTSSMFSSTWIDKVTFGDNVDFSALTNVTNMHYYMNNGNPDGTTTVLTYPTNADFSSLATTANWFAGVQGPTTGPLTTCQIDNLIRRFRATAYNNSLNINFYQGKITEAPSVVRAQEAELVANGWTITENSTDATLPFAYPEYMVDPSSATSLTPSLLPPVADRNFSSTNAGVTVDQNTGVLSWASNFEGFTTVRCTYADGCYNEVNVGVQVPTVLRRLIPAAGQTASFNLRGSQYIDWGDGTAEANSGSASHVYAAAGTGWGTWRTIKIFDKNATEKFTGFNGISSANYDRIDIMQWGSQVFDGLSFNNVSALGLRAPSNNPVNTTLLTSFYRMFRAASNYKSNARFADPNNNLGSWKTSTATGGGAITSIEEMISGSSMLGCSILDDHSDLTWSFPAGTTATAGTYTGNIFGRSQSGTYVNNSIRWLVKVEGSGTVTLDNNNFQAIPNYMYTGRELSVGDVIRIDANAFGSLNNAITLTLTSNNILNVNQNPGNLNNWDTSQITNFSRFFSRSSQLGGNRRLNMNLSNWNLSNAEDISFFVGTDGNNAGLITGVNDISPKLVSAADSPTGSSYVAWDTSNLTNIRQFNYFGSNPLGILKYWRFNTTNNVSLSGLFYKMNLQPYASDEPCKTQVILASDPNNPYGVNYTAWNMEKVSSVSNFARRDGVNNQSITALTPALGSWQITDVLTTFNTMSYAYDGNYTFSPTVGHWDISGITGSNKWQHNRSGTFKFSQSAYDNLLDINNGWGAHASTANSGVTLNMGTSVYSAGIILQKVTTTNGASNAILVYDFSFSGAGVQIGDIAYNSSSGEYSKVIGVSHGALSTDRNIWGSAGVAFRIEQSAASKGRYALIDPNGPAWNITDSGAYIPPYVPFKMTFDTSTTKTISIPGSTGSWTINWGDGTTETAQSGTVSHTYGASVTQPTIEIGAQSDTVPFTSVVMNSSSSKTLLIDIPQWGSVQWSTFNNAFRGCNNSSMQISATDSPDFSQDPDTTFMFYQADLNNSDMSHWDLTGLTSTENMFRYASSTNGFSGTTFGDWDTSSITSLYAMFMQSSLGTQNLNGWDTSGLLSIASFMYITGGNPNISNWDTSSVTSMAYAFARASSFNSDLSVKTVSAGDSPTGVSYQAWDVSNVTSMENMFREATSFNQDIGDWNVSKVESLKEFIRENDVFNHDISGWNTSSLKTIKLAFYHCGAFNQNLSNWNILNFNTNDSNEAQQWAYLSNISSVNYTDTIVGWAVQVYNNSGSPSGVNASGNNKTFAGTRTSDSASGQTYAVKYGSNWTATGWTTAQDAYDYLVEEASWSL